VLKPLGALAGLAAGGLAWGHFEAGWVRLRRLEVPIPGLAGELDGLRIAHLSDFHLGVPSRGERAVRRAVDWAAALDADLNVISGDLVSRPRGEPLLRELLERLPRCYAVLGNHDLADSRDPFSVATPLSDLGPATLLGDDATTVEVRGRTVQIVGVDPLTYGLHRSHPERRADPAADLRILICHFPGVIRRLPEGAFDLVLAGHLHGGQICVPWPGGKIRLAHPGARYAEGLYPAPPAALHVSAGLGTTFVPFRFFARPEATELVLRPA
jgi:predicted MPP superfamily phosphohydrolase